MDIRFHELEADAAERDAVDSVLGPPVSAWAGGIRDIEPEGHSATFGGHAARSQRDLLLPVLHAVQGRFGWLPPGALNYISRRLTVPPAEVFGVATFYHLFSLTPSPRGGIHACHDIRCRIKGAERLGSGLEGIHGSHFSSKRSPCVGLWERAP